MSHQYNKGDEQSDDVDRIFARLQPIEPPPYLARQIMQALPPIAVTQTNHLLHRWRRWIPVAVAMIFLSLSVRLGSNLQDAGVFDVLGDFIGQTNTANPGDYWDTLASVMPWFDIILTAAAFVGFLMTTSLWSQPARSSLK